MGSMGLRGASSYLPIWPIPLQGWFRSCYGNPSPLRKKEIKLHRPSSLLSSFASWTLLCKHSLAFFFSWPLLIFYIPPSYILLIGFPTCCPCSFFCSQLLCVYVHVCLCTCCVSCFFFHFTTKKYLVLYVGGVVARLGGLGVTQNFIRNLSPFDCMFFFSGRMWYQDQRWLHYVDGAVRKPWRICDYPTHMTLKLMKCTMNRQLLHQRSKIFAPLILKDRFPQTDHYISNWFCVILILKTN